MQNPRVSVKVGSGVFQEEADRGGIVRWVLLPLNGWDKDLTMLDPKVGLKT